MSRAVEKETIRVEVLTCDRCKTYKSKANEGWFGAPHMHTLAFIDVGPTGAELHLCHLCVRVLAEEFR